MTRRAKSVPGEEALIRGYLAPLAAGFPGAYGLKDDCATIAPSPGHELVVKTDPIAEGVHFLPSDPPADIAWKALAVNVSDLVAKGARPVAYLMALSFPQAPTASWMREFARGLGEAQAAFGIALAGGDTDKRPGPVTISITVFGELPAGTMVRRGAAQAGDRILVSGTLGGSALGLATLRAEAGGPQPPPELALTAAERDDLVARYRRPQPRLSLAPVLRAHARAAMDLSDGIVKDLGRMIRASGCGAVIEAARLPLSPPVARLLAIAPKLFAKIVSAGDDYEVLAACAPESAAAFIQGARDAGAPLTDVGEMTDGRDLVVRDASGAPLDVADAGYDHF